MNLFFYVFISAAGLLFGSFLNVCILRFPARKSVITAPSACPKCGRRLRANELVPVLSWLAQSGRCRHCNDKISAQYPLVELANAALWLISAAAFINHNKADSLLDLAVQCAVLSALLGVAITDAQTGEIPLAFNAFIAICAVLKIGHRMLLGAPFSDILPHIIGAFAVSLPLCVVYITTRGGALGGGDIKLLAAAGLFLGWAQVTLGFFAACLIGSIVHLVRMRFAGAGLALRLGPYLVLGLALSMFFGTPLINWYISSIRSF